MPGIFLVRTLYFVHYRYTVVAAKRGFIVSFVFLSDEWIQHVPKFAIDHIDIAAMATDKYCILSSSTSFLHA